MVFLGWCFLDLRPHAGIFSRNPVRKITPRSSQISSNLPKSWNKNVTKNLRYKRVLLHQTRSKYLSTPEKCTNNVHIYRKIITPNYHTLSVGLHIWFPPKHRIIFCRGSSKKYRGSMRNVGWISTKSDYHNVIVWFFWLFANIVNARRGLLKEKLSLKHIMSGSCKKSQWNGREFRPYFR